MTLKGWRVVKPQHNKKKSLKLYSFPSVIYFKYPLFCTSRFQHYYKTPEVPDFSRVQTNIGNDKHQKETTKEKKSDKKREATKANDVSSSSSQEPEWKTWEKTEQF